MVPEPNQPVVRKGTLTAAGFIHWRYADSGAISITKRLCGFFMVWTGAARKETSQQRLRLSRRAFVTNQPADASYGYRRCDVFGRTAAFRQRTGENLRCL